MNFFLLIRRGESVDYIRQNRSKKVTIDELYELIKLPRGVIEQLKQYEKHRKGDIPSEIRERLFLREHWDEGVKELQSYLGEDPYGINILWEQLNLVRSYTYEEYIKRSISIDIFSDTFGFVTRFVSGTKDADGKYKYEWAWWLQRQITLQEFRIGSLEYEFVESNGVREVEVHIPSDADMNIKALCRSVKDFRKFDLDLRSRSR